MRETKRTKVFGTDGIRARVGEFPLTEVLLPRLALAIKTVLPGSKVILGRDTRESGQQIEQLLSQGFAGLDQLYSCGVVPTPGLSRIVAGNDFDYGVMITASHNPYHDNGVKVFNSQGEKLSNGEEEQIERIFVELMEQDITTDTGPAIQELTIDDYQTFLLSQIQSLKGKRLKIVLDCANGATFRIAPEVMGETGYTTTVINSRPSGRNINEKCGSLSPESLANRVKAENADMGIAFDGDGDRLIVTDNNGHILEGDHILYLLAKYLDATRQVGEKVVVGTVMSNGGLDISLAEMGFQLVRTDVGDRHVYHEMKNRKAILGGEKAGHIILSELQKTGDGILSAIYFLKALSHFRLHPADVFSMIQLFPQVLRSFYVKEKRDLAQWAGLQKMIRQFNTQHGKDSRILIRYSGTEHKIRIMIESADANIITGHLEKFEDFIKSEIGG